MGREHREGKGRRLAALVSKERKKKEKVRTWFGSWLLKPLRFFPPSLGRAQALTQTCTPAGMGGNAVL